MIHWQSETPITSAYQEIAPMIVSFTMVAFQLTCHYPVRQDGRKHGDFLSAQVALEISFVAKDRRNPKCSIDQRICTGFRRTG